VELPKETCRCWCYIAEQNDLGIGHYQWNCSYVEGKGFSIDAYSNSNPFSCNEYQGHVTHWRPLQEPPKDNYGLVFAKYCDVKNIEPPHVSGLSIDAFQKAIKEIIG
jgi:hypothetical protein